jgi:hypothetical protein
MAGKGRPTMTNDKIQSSNKCQMSNRRSLKKFPFAGEKLFHERKPLSLRSNASKVTLSGFAGGEYLPRPASKGLAFPFLLALDGYPTSPANYAHGQRFSPGTQENRERQNLNSRSELLLPVFQRSQWGVLTFEFWHLNFDIWNYYLPGISYEKYTDC